MPPWIIKAAIQGALSQLPDPQRYNRLFQKYVTRSLALEDGYFLEKWRQCERHVDTYFRLRPDSAESTTELVAVELGTGWFPITPIGLALNGARRVYSIDTQDLLAHAQVVDTLAAYQRMLASGRVRARRSEALELVDDVLSRATRLSARELLGAVGVEAVIADARHSKLPADSVDLYCSNNTLEHIPRAVIVDVFREASRLASPSGIMSHFIDMADHYSTFDRNITAYNFLKYSERTWPLFNNQLQYVNRLRISDFRAMHEESGYTILEEDNEGEPELLDSINVAPCFRNYTRDDLAVVTTWMTSRVKA